MHQDQVATLPGHATTIAGSDICPHALIAYGKTAISFQGHPEFTAEYAHDLITLRRGKLFSALQAGKALATLNRPSDSDQVADWIMNFLRSALSHRAQTRRKPV